MGEYLPIRRQSLIEAEVTVLSTEEMTSATLSKSFEIRAFLLVPAGHSGIPLITIENLEVEGGVASLPVAGRVVSSSPWLICLSSSDRDILVSSIEEGLDSSEVIREDRE